MRVPRRPQTTPPALRPAGPAHPPSALVSESPLLSADRYVLYGNHRDSWVHGAVDPSSGTAVLLELSRVLGTLLKKGEATLRPDLGTLPAGGHLQPTLP